MKKVLQAAAANSHELTFAGGALTASIGAGLVYPPAGLMLFGALVMGVTWLSARASDGRKAAD